MLCLYILLNASRYGELTFLFTCMHIIMILEFNIHSLPPGWVKETAFRNAVMTSEKIRWILIDKPQGLFIWKIQSWFYFSYHIVWFCIFDGSNYYKDIPLIKVCGTILRMWRRICGHSCTNHECHWSVVFGQVYWYGNSSHQYLQMNSCITFFRDFANLRFLKFYLCLDVHSNKLIAHDHHIFHACARAHTHIWTSYYL